MIRVARYAYLVAACAFLADDAAAAIPPTGA